MFAPATTKDRAAAIRRAYSAAHQPTAPTTDRRIRRTAKAQAKLNLPPTVKPVRSYNQLADCNDWCAGEFVPMAESDIQFARLKATMIVSYPLQYRPTIDHANIGGTRHENACAGSGNWRERSVSAAKTGRDVYLLGKTPVAVSGGL